MIDKVNVQSDAQLLHGKRLAAAVRAGAEGASGIRASHGPLAELCASLLSEELETLESAADCAAAKMPREPRVRHEIRTNWHPDLASMACESPAPHKSLFISHSRSRCAALSSPGCRNAIQKQGIYAAESFISIQSSVRDVSRTTTAKDMNVRSNESH